MEKIDTLIDTLGVANYIINSTALMYENGYYCAHWSPKKGLNYDGNNDEDNITVYARCPYDEDVKSREEFDAKESIDDPDFLEVCENLTHQLNEEIEEYYAYEE